ncbi:unnamed protein product [Knipowitschia caucasica]
MTSVGKTLIVLGALIAAAYGLKCRQCVVGIFGSCLFPSEITCSNSTSNCYTGEAQFNATGSLTLHNRGCLDSDLCGKTLTGSILGAGYTSSFTCCTTDLCNSASSLSVTAATMVMLLCSFWASQ